jgi:hypothetical protein
MLQELGRIIAVLVLLIARALGRAYQGLRFLVRRAKQTRSATAMAVPRGGRLLDIAALSVTADILVLVEWWRRDAGSVASAALIGLCLGALGAAAIGVFLRGPVVQYALAGTEALRLAAVVAYAFAAPTVVAGGTTEPAWGAFAIGAIIALAITERALWVVAAHGRSGDAVRYTAFLLLPILLLALVALILDGLVALILAQVALLTVMCLAFVISTPAARPPKPPKPPKTPKPPKELPAEPPAQRTEVDPDSPEGSYHLYRPNSLKPPESS